MERELSKNFETRKPIINKETDNYDHEKIDTEWLYLTEAIRRDVVDKPDVRESVKSFVSTPIDEQMPNDFLNNVKAGIRTERLKSWYKKSIGDFLALPSVPDEDIGVDIQNSNRLYDPKEILRMLENDYKKDSPEYYKRLQDYIDSGSFINGITPEERLVIAQRYRFARDVKLLAFGAEVLDEKDNIKTGEDGELILPSGTIINMDIEDETKREEFMNPLNWVKRRQIKDRVYEIEVGSTKYILKEKKTARHTDTKEGGHKDGLTSLEEFKVSRNFKENACVEEGDIIVNWEKAVATVRFPDGFQFTVFEYEDGLCDYADVINQYVECIKKERELYEPEYNTVKVLSQKMMNDPRVLQYYSGNTESGLTQLLQLLKLKKETVTELSFEDFARVKALRTRRKADFLRDIAVDLGGYENSDHDGYAYKVKEEQGKKPKLETLGFDFEYFIKSPREDLTDYIDERKRSEQKEENRSGIGFMIWRYGNVTRIQQAAYFALMAVEGNLIEESL